MKEEKELLSRQVINLPFFCGNITSHFLHAKDSAKKESNFLDLFILGFYSYLNDGFQYGVGIAGGYYKNAYVQTRYNYEELKSFSAFAGYSFENSEKAIEWELIQVACFG